MTNFNKKDFNYQGGYLEYKGSYEGQPTYDEVYGTDKIHSSRIGMPFELFIARFKYSGPFTKSVFVKQLIKNFTVEEYAAKRAEGGFENSPLNILKLNDEKYVQAVNHLSEHTDVKIESFSDGKRTFGGVKCFTGIINNEIDINKQIKRIKINK